MKIKIRNILLHNKDTALIVDKILEEFDKTVDEEKVEYWRDRFYTSNTLKKAMKADLDNLKAENGILKRKLK